MRENFPEGDKVYFLDTSAILHDPDSIEILSAGGNIAVILTHVLKELDNSKTFRDQAGINSRAVKTSRDFFVKKY
jgi:predicted ribonuclease YlaK